MAGWLHCDDAACDASDLDRRVRGAAAVLAGLGVERGHAVALLLRNGMPFVEASPAAQEPGPLPVAINWHFTAAEVAHVLHDCGAGVLVGGSDLLDGIVPPCSPRLTVIPVPDAEYGERLIAFVQPEAGADLDVSALPAALRRLIAGYKVLREYHLAPALPRDDSGRIFERRLRDQLAGLSA